VDSAVVLANTLGFSKSFIGATIIAVGTSLPELTIDLQANALEQAFKRIGPEVFNASASGNFLKAHKKPLSGPRIENGRWIVEELREHYLATEFLKFLLKKLSKEEVKELRFLLKKARVLNQKQILLHFCRLLLVNYPLFAP